MFPLNVCLVSESLGSVYWGLLCWIFEGWGGVLMVVGSFSGCADWGRVMALVFII